MKGFLLSIFILAAAIPAAAQPSRTPARKSSAATPASPSQKKTPIDDRSELDKANAVADSSEKVEALKKFIQRFPRSTLIDEAKLALSSAAFAAAEENRAVGEMQTSVDLYKLAVSSAPVPIPAVLFNDSLSKIPNTLYWASNRVAGLEIAKALEEKAATDADQLSTLASFYIGIENGDEAVRVAELAVKAGESSSRAYATLGLAQRVNFRLDESAAAYAKAVELEPTSVALKRSLAEIRRATGKADDAVALYREVVAADENDMQGRNGLVMSLFDAGKTEDAEKELTAVLAANPRNVMLLASAAYWYAANKNAEKAIDLAQRAVNVEPRYVWSYIALGRGYMLADRPQDAEEALLKARQYGNFPSLDYALASARYKAGFYRDAVDALQKTFTIDGDTLSTKIGNRVLRKGVSFADILADERKASILEAIAPDDTEADNQLKNLLAMSIALSAEKPDAAATARAADAFVAGDDNSKIHRELYAASVLLDRKVAADKALELAQSAIGNSDLALSIPNSGAYVMASELYESRQLALSRGELIKAPQVPHQMLSAILRGRVEDLIGWGLLQQNNPSEAALHFRRAVSILPDKSAWWRAAQWRLGTALEADGKEPEALDAYVKSYSIDKPDVGRYTTVANLYKKLNGSDEGLEEKIGRPPRADLSADIVAKNDLTMPTALPAAVPTPNIMAAAPTPAPPVQATVQSESPATTDVSTNMVKVESTPTPAITDISRTAVPTLAPSLVEVPAATPPSPSAVTEQTPSPTPSPEAAVTPTPEPRTIEIEKVAAKTEPTPAPALEPTAVPTPQATPDATPQPLPTPDNKPADVETAKLEPPAKPDADKPMIEPSPERPSFKRAEVVISDSLAKPTAKPDEKAQTRSDTKTGSGPATPSTARSLFEPVVITIPKRDAPAAEQKAERPTLEIDRSNLADSRPRLIDGQPVNVIEPTTCDVSVSQDKVSLLSNGGEASVLLGVDRADQLGAVKYMVSDPDAISVAVEKGFEGIEGRALFVIRSISERTGTFRVTFYLPCGKRDVLVTVN